jgi:hypothetical protein
MREWQLITITYDGGTQTQTLARAEEATRFHKAMQLKMPVQLKTKAELTERLTGFALPAQRDRPTMVKLVFVDVGDVSEVSVEDWDHSTGGAQ